MGMCVSFKGKIKNCSVIINSNRKGDSRDTNFVKGNSSGETNKNTNTDNNIPSLQRSYLTIDENIEKSEEITITFPAIVGEIELPILLEKGSAVEISIKSGSNVWSFYDKNYDKKQSNFLGNPNEQFKGKNIGALVFRVSKEKDTHLIDKLKVTFHPNDQSTILISANLNPFDYNNYKPNGSVLLKIKGGRCKSFFEIYRVLGYNICPVPPKKMSMFEEAVLMYINLIRVNPQRFYKEYILPQNLEISEEDEKFFKEVTPVSPLTWSEILFNAAKEHCIDLGTNGTTGHLGSDNSTLKNRIEKHSKGKEIPIFGENCEFSKNNPLLIVSYMILDFSKSKRNNIFYPEFNSIGVSLQDHYSFRYCCVVVFGGG